MMFIESLQPETVSLMDSKQVLIMVLNCTLSKKVTERVELFVRNHWCLAASESEITVALGRAKAIRELAIAEGRPNTEGENLVHAGIIKQYVAVKRGLSQVSYDQWINARRGLSKIKKANYDADLIRKGLLLGAHERREFREKNKYERAAKNIAG